MNGGMSGWMDDVWIVTAGIVWHCRTIAYITANIIYFIYCIPNYVITGEVKSKSLSCV